MSWSISDYNNFLSEARELYEIGYREAQELYRELREGIGESVTADYLHERPDSWNDTEHEGMDYFDVLHDAVGSVAYEVEEYEGYDEWIDEGWEFEVYFDESYKED